MAMSYDDDNNSILDNAAMNWNEDVFGAVLSGIEKDLSPQEVRTNDYLVLFRIIVTCSRVERTLDKSLIPKLE